MVNIDIDMNETLDEQLERLKKLDDTAAETSTDDNRWQQRYERLSADFSNYKRRTAEERAEMREKVEQELLLSFLSLYDDFQRLERHHRGGAALADGVKAIENKWQKWLSDRGVVVLDPVGQDFDPERHEAVMHVPVSRPELHGKVAQVIENGYLYKGKVLRFAKVAVGRFEDPATGAESEEAVKGEMENDF